MRRQPHSLIGRHAGPVGIARVHVVRALAGTAVVLVLARAALPWALEVAINRALARNESISGRVNDVDLELWRGAYQIGGLELARRRPEGSPPFITARLIDFSMDWNELFHGRLIAKGRVIGPTVDIGAFPESGDADEAKDEADDVAATVMPVRISRVEVADGILRVPAGKAVPGGSLELTRITGEARDVRVTRSTSAERPTTVHASAVAPGGGELSVDLRFMPFASPVAFDVDASLENVDLVRINPIIRSAIGIDVESGTGSVYAEAKAGDGAFRGYVKPILSNVNFLDIDQEKASLGQKLKEGLADIAKDILSNRKKDSVGARVPFEGRFGDPKIGVWQAVGTVFRHAFIRALRPSVEGRL